MIRIICVNKCVTIRTYMSIHITQNLLFPKCSAQIKYTKNIYIFLFVNKCITYFFHCSQRWHHAVRNYTCRGTQMARLVKPLGLGFASGSWDPTPCWALYSAWSPLETLSLSLCHST